MKKILSIVIVGIGVMILGGCSDKDFPVPLASTVPKFTYTADGQFAPATVTFKNESVVPERAGNVTYTWNFGDGSSSTEVNPVHFYKKPGAYVVNLVVVTSASNEINDASQTVSLKDPNATGTPIYFTDGNLVFGGLINESNPFFSSLNIQKLQESYGVSIDTVHDLLYITDSKSEAIYTSKMDGGDFKIFRSSVGPLVGVTIDYDSAMIYWDTNDGIRRADMTKTDVSQFEDFVTGQVNGPEGIAIGGGKVYWNNYDGNVWVKNVDGTDEKQIVTTAGGGSIRWTKDKIYFDDYEAKGDIRLKSANLDGGSVTTLATGISRVVYGLAVDSHESKIYWGDRDKGVIMRADLNGNNAAPWYVSDGSNPQGIVIGKAPAKVE